jgi:hypothetical protein
VTLCDEPARSWHLEPVEAGGDAAHLAEDCRSFLCRQRRAIAGFPGHVFAHGEGRRPIVWLEIRGQHAMYRKTGLPVAFARPDLPLQVMLGVRGEARDAPASALQIHEVDGMT